MSNSVRYLFRKPLPLRIRNSVCAVFALALIASGRVRRRRRQALTSDVVSGIYFHRPAKDLFAHCIAWLSKSGYTFVSLDDVIAYLYDGAKLPKGAVWLSFDDGYRDLLTDVLPLVIERNIPVTLFLASGLVEGNGWFPWEAYRDAGGIRERDAMTVSDVRRLAQYSQVTFGSHTVNHLVTADLNGHQTAHELRESKRQLERWTGKPVVCFAYPEGVAGGREEIHLRSLGYRIAATTENAFLVRTSDVYRLPRFSVADDISLPEAICNMTGVWRPFIEPLISVTASFVSAISWARAAANAVLARISNGRSSQLTRKVSRPC